MSNTRQVSGPVEWTSENWVVGQYTPSENFKNITNHSCICRKDDMRLIALTGPATDLESQRLADLFAVAPALLEALKSARGWVSTYAMQTYSQVASKELEAIDALIAKAEGNNS